MQDHFHANDRTYFEKAAWKHIVFHLRYGFYRRYLLQGRKKMITDLKKLNQYIMMTYLPLTAPYLKEKKYESLV